MKSKTWNILFSVTVAFFLWLYVITVVSPEYSQDVKNIPVTLGGETVLEERNLMLISDGVSTVNVTLRGSRSDVVNINNSNIVVVADLSWIMEAGTYQLTYTATPPNTVSPVSVIDRNPKTISVTVAQRLTKKVPVVVSYLGSVPEGYIVDKGNEMLSLSEVTITGPDYVVEPITQAVLEIDCDGRTETIVEELRYKLCDAQGDPQDVSLVETEAEEIRLEVRVASLKKIPLMLDVQSGGGANSENSQIVIEPKEITVSGGSAAMEQLESLRIGAVNLAEIGEETTLEFEIVMPEGVKNESGVTTATVTISFPELTKKEFTVTEFTTVNVAEGMEAEVLTKQLTITVRGPRDQVTALTAEDIRVELDLTDVIHTDSVVPTVRFGEEFPDVGVVGKYTVSVTVVEPAPEETSEG